MTTFDPKDGVAELAALVSGLEDGTDFASGEAGVLQKVLLTGKPDERDPLKYAEIMRAVRTDPDVSTWMHFAARVEEVNGRRRAKGADMQALASALDSIVKEAETSEVATSNHGHVLLGGALYNQALICRGLQNYGTACAIQRRSAAWFGLAGKMDKMFTGIFASQVEATTVAFTGGKDEDIVRAIRAMIAARDLAKHALPEYPSWMEDNASIHIAWALMMATELPIEAESEVNDDIAELNDGHSEDFAAAGESRFAQWAKVFATYFSYLTEEENENVAGTTPVELPSSSADNAALTIQIIVALAEQKLGRDEDAKKRLEAVAAHEGNDGGIPISVARRILAS